MANDRILAVLRQMDPQRTSIDLRDRLDDPVVDVDLIDALARFENLTSLDLSENQLRAIPPEIGELISLRKLDVSKNEIVELPSELSALTHLVEIDVWTNQLAALPSSLSRLPNLEIVTAARNQLKSLPLEFRHSPNLRTWQLSRNAFSDLPLESISDSVGQLFMSFNPVESISSQICEFSNLESLAVSGVSSVPVELGEMPKLKRLALSNAHIGYVPECLFKLQLEHLCLGEVGLRCLPARIREFDSLRNLHLGGNLLDGLPDEIGDLCKLERLVLDGNQFRELPAVVLSLSSLVQLGLADNQLQYLPEGIGTLRELQELGIDGNELTDFPRELLSLPKLRNFIVRNNPVGFVPNLKRYFAERDAAGE